MSNEEHIHQDLLLDKEWERQQIRTFTAWVNFQLKKVGLQIKDILTDLRDGRMFIRLLEVISNENLPPPEKKNQRVHQVINVNRCLEFIAKKGVKLANIGAEEIVDGNVKMTLGTIWVIILRFVIQDISSTKSHDGLLLWVKKKTEGYKGANPNNWTTSFQDGLVFNALIHRHRPDLLDYDKLNKENKIENLNKAFEIAENHLGIPRMLDAQDVVMMPDQKSMMTYTSAFYQVFSKSHASENAARRVQRVLDTNLENANKIRDYERISSDLLQWIKDKTECFQDDSFEKEPLEKLFDELNSMKCYRTDEKPPKAKEKAVLEKLASTIKTRMYLQNRPPYVPIDDHSIDDIQEAWNGLNSHEKIRLERLHMLIQNLLFAEHIYRKFQYKCDQQNNWMAGRPQSLNVDISKMNLPELQAQKRKLASTQSDMDTREPRLRMISGLYEKLKEINYSDMPQVESQYSNVMRSMEELNSAHRNLLSEIEKREKLLMEIENLMLAYAQKASEVKGSLDDAFEDLNDTYQVNTVRDIDVLKEELGVFVKFADQNKSKIEECRELDSKISAVSNTGNIYSSVTVSELENRLNEVYNAAKARKSALEQEGTNQELNESLKKEFAHLATTVDDFRALIIKRIHDAPTQSSSLEEHKKLLEKINEEVDVFFKVKIPEIEKISAKLQEAKVFHNPYTSHTQESLNADYNALFDLLSTSVTEVENQIILRNESSLTEKQVKEYRKTFDYFDKDRFGFLTIPLFRNFLISLEYNIPENEGEDGPEEKDFQRILSKVDSKKQGKIYFNDFLNFLAVEAKDTDSSDQIIESLRILAGGKEYITEEELRQHFRDKTPEIISRMTKSNASNAPPNSYDYRSFASALYGESDI